MIDIDKTIYKNIIQSIGMLRYQAKDNPKLFKAILELIILTDMLEWASGLNEELCIQLALMDLIISRIIHNPNLCIMYKDSSTAYVNVNTPQSNDTWKRVWDSAHCITVPDNYKFLDCPRSECQLPSRHLIKVDHLIIKEIIP